MVMKRIATYFENTLTAVAFAESGEFETAKQFVEEFHTTRGRHCRSNKNKLERLQLLRAKK